MTRNLVKIFLCFTISLSLSCETPNPNNSISLHGEWEFVWGSKIDPTHLEAGNQNWKKFLLPGTPESRKDENYVLIRKFLPTDLTYRDPALLFSIMLEDFEIFLDGESIYQFGNPYSELGRIQSYIFPHVISLPNDFQGKELRIFIHSKYKDYIGPDRVIMLTERGQIMQSILIADLPRYLLGSIYLLIACVSLILFVLSDKNRIFLYYSLMLLFNGGITIAADYVSMNFFADPKTPVYMYYFNLYLLPIFLYAFLGEIYQNQHRKIFKTGIVFYTLYFLIASFLIIFYDYGFLNLEVFFNTSILIGLLPLLSIIIYHSYKGDKDSKILLFGFIIFTLCVAHDILTDFDIFVYKVSLYWYGMFSFLLFQGATLFRKLYHIQKNNELKENELLVAKKIQNSILSPFPDNLTNWEFTSIYEPMREVGGDFYDILIDDKGNIGVILIDVSGHGVAAALIASMAKVSFSHCQNFLNSPDKVLSEMEKSLGDKMNDHFATAFYLSLSSREPLVQYSSAGHPSALLVSDSEKEVLEFRTRARPIGINPKSDFPKNYLHLKEGDLICIYTDGVTELNDPYQNEYGSTRLKEILLMNYSLPLAEIKEKLLQDFKAWTKNLNIQKHDDLTLILIRYNGEIT
ncbi:MAG: hypothetical protein CK427_09680 [Leptospira sp.]|nr:MAG: hypothetical protein CK427_09680 [Leptospira sp.]